MRQLFSLRHSLELTAVVIAAIAFVQVLYQFIIGKHFVIPTAILFICVLFGNLARYAMRGMLWAKHLLFWFGFIFTCYLFFAIFFAQRFRVMLGDAWCVRSLSDRMPPLRTGQLSGSQDGAPPPINSSPGSAGAEAESCSQ